MQNYPQKERVYANTCYSAPSVAALKVAPKSAYLPNQLSEYDHCEYVKFYDKPHFHEKKQKQNEALVLKRFTINYLSTHIAVLYQCIKYVL